LAEKQLIRERKPYTSADIIDKAVVIRKWIDDKEEVKERTQFKRRG
jgi:hypothetical protein